MILISLGLCSNAQLCQETFHSEVLEESWTLHEGGGILHLPGGHWGPKWAQMGPNNPRSFWDPPFLTPETTVKMAKFLGIDTWWLRQASAQPARSRGSLPSSRPGDLSAEMFHRNHQERWTCWTPETCGENIMELSSEIDTFGHWNPNYCNLLFDCPLHVDLDNPPSISFSHKNNVFHWYIWVHVENQTPDINL